MIYAYNGSAEEGCGENSLGDQKYSVGFTYLKGPRGPFLYVEGSDGQDSLVAPPVGSGDFDILIEVRATNAMIPSNCFDSNAPVNCNPQAAADFYNLLNTKYFDGTPALDNNGMPSPFMYTGNPADANEWSLCTDQSIAETAGILSSAEVLLQPSARTEIISAIYYTDDIDTDCPDNGAIKYKDDVVQALYNNCLYQHFTPSAPELQVYHTNTGIEIGLSEVPYDYNERVLQAIPGIHDDRHYTFEGVKIYQVASMNFDMTELNNLELSVLVYQGDIQNNITDIVNFKSDFEAGVQNWIAETKVSGANNGIEEKIFFDYDFINDQPIEPSKELYYVAVSYGYNNYEEFDPMGFVDSDGTPNTTGQQYRYIESNCGLKAQQSDIDVSGITSPYDSGLYGYIYSENTINLFDVEDDLTLQLISIDGKSLDQWNVQKGNTYTSDNLSERLAKGLYLLHVTSRATGLNGSHKLVVVR